MRLKFKTSLLDKEESYFIACSGGVDSVAITHYLVTKFLKKSPFILHVNNNLFESDNIAAQNVKRLASSLDCTFIEKQYTVDATSNLEDACRNTRLKAYRECKASVIICHHLDDAIESYLMNCFNGKTEFLPIPEATVMCPDQVMHSDSIFNYKCIIRPFLTTITKKELEKYCMENNLMQYVINDPLNEKSTRGWLRREVLPLIKQKYPGIDKVVRKKYL